MEFRALGRTGVQVSSICLGCMMFGGRTDQQATNEIVAQALDGGVNFFDTANVYNLGRSEEATGVALKTLGARDRVVVATKVHGTMDAEDPNMQGNSRRHIIQQCEASLRRLDTDYIDLYQIHRPRPGIAIDETLRALDDLVTAGKVRYIGSSTFAAWQVVEALWASKEYGLNRFVTEQPPYNLLDRRIERELIPMAQTFGVGLIPWSPLAGGLLTGKYSRGEPPPADSRFGQGGLRAQQKARWVDGLFDIVDALAPIARDKGCTLAQLALAWCEQQPGVASAIIGPRTVEQLQDNLGAAAVTISDEDRARIDAIVPPGRMVSPFYEAAFGPHRYRV